MAAGHGTMRLIAIAVTVSVLAAVIGVGPAAAQGSSAAGLSPCKDVVTTSADALQASQAAIEKDLDAKRRELEALPALGAAASAAQKAASERLQGEIRALEERLVDVIYRVECLRADKEDVVRSDDAPLVEVTGWYATNRERTGKAGFESFYGSTDAKSLQYGRFTVSIPATHTLGTIEMPSLWRLELTPDPSKHFVIKSLNPLADMAALAELREALTKTKGKVLLLFVHGFNNSFADAARRTAQLSFDLKFPGIPMFMSWPATKRYTHDLASVRIANSALSKLLDDIATLPFDEVYILAHSLGNELVTQVLAERQKGGSDLSRITEILLAAPDINAIIFKERIAPVLAKLTKMRKTIYASANDVALKAAKKIIDGYGRVGDTSRGVQVYESFDTIDSSKVAPLTRAFGHSYVFDSRSVIADLENLLIRRWAATKRGLKRMGPAGNQYWMIE